MLVPVASALHVSQCLLLDTSQITHAELVELLLGKTMVEDDLMLVEDDEALLVVALLELGVIEILVVEVVRVVEPALAEVEVLPLAVAVEGGKVPEGAP